MVPYCQKAHSRAAPSGWLCSLWRFNHVFCPLPTLVRSYILLVPGTVFIFHSFLALKIPQPPLPRQIISSSLCSLLLLPYTSPISDWFYLVYVLIYSFIYSAMCIVYLLWVSTWLKVINRQTLFCLYGAQISGRKTDIKFIMILNTDAICFTHINIHLLNSA